MFKMAVFSSEVLEMKQVGLPVTTNLVSGRHKSRVSFVSTTKRNS